MHMPGMSGFDLQKRLIDDGCSVPIIFVSAFYTEALRTRAMAAGAIGFMSKPFNVEQMIEYLNLALKRKSEDR
jgi:FixJ family two-component response regulator